jgi:hypothetical protein
VLGAGSLHHRADDECGIALQLAHPAGVALLADRLDRRGQRSLWPAVATTDVLSHRSLSPTGRFGNSFLVHLPQTCSPVMDSSSRPQNTHVLGTPTPNGGGRSLTSSARPYAAPLGSRTVPG